MVTVADFSELLELIGKKTEAPVQALIIKRGYPPKEIVVDPVNNDLVSLGFKNNENLIVEVDMSRLPKVEHNESFINEKKALMAPNQGCDP